MEFNFFDIEIRVLLCWEEKSEYFEIRKWWTFFPCFLNVRNRPLLDMNDWLFRYDDETQW